MSKISLIATRTMKQFCHSSKCIDIEIIEKLAEEHDIKVTAFPEITKIFVVDQKDLPKLENLVRSHLSANLFERLSDLPEIKNLF